VKPNNTWLEINSVAPAIPAYIEVAFHDNLEDANWIINNTHGISRAIGTSILNLISG
jgi:hypothetical protein